MNAPEQKNSLKTHSITDKVIQYLKKEPNISNEELAEKLGITVAAAKGWRTVAEETNKGRKWGY